MIGNRITAGSVKLKTAFPDGVHFDTNLLGNIGRYGIEADISVEYQNTATVYGRFIRNYYVVNFLENRLFPFQMKQFSMNTLWIVFRNDLKFIGSVIDKVLDTSSTWELNDILCWILNQYTGRPADDRYDIDLGMTELDLSIDFGSSIDGQADENLLLLCTAEDNGEQVIFEYYNDEIYDTRISTNLSRAGIKYTVQSVFQIWQIDELNGLKLSNQRYLNSPQTGSIKFNNLDNEILIAGNI